MQEGTIKFNCEWIKTEPFKESTIRELNNWRSIMFENGLIGMYDNGVGYGNISIRQPGGFLISGTATGGIQTLNTSHYVKVSSYNLEKNRLTCVGPIKASSESLSHAVVYECSPETGAVIHIHNRAMWEHLLNKMPSSRNDVTYGTPEMAMEIKRLFVETNVSAEKMIIMGGHPEGIISFGKTIAEAGSRLLKYFENQDIPRL